MTTTTKLSVVPGDQISFYESGFTFSTSGNISSGIVAVRGQTITITADLIEASMDRLGNSWLQKLDDPNETRFKKGPWPESESIWVRGTSEHERERERRRVSAHAIADEVERGKALRAVLAEFGPAASKQVSTEYRGSTALPVREQA